MDFNELLASLRLPAIAAPMTTISTPALVGEACAAGIVGAFPTSNAASIAELNDWFAQIQDRRAASERPAGPMAANLIVGKQNQRLDEDVDCVVAHRPELRARAGPDEGADGAGGDDGPGAGLGRGGHAGADALAGGPRASKGGLKPLPRALRRPKGLQSGPGPAVRGQIRAPEVRSPAEKRHSATPSLLIWFAKDDMVVYEHLYTQ